MKFGKVFEEKLKESEIPESWISNGSIHYKKLKKILSKLVKELESIGLLSEIKDLRVNYTISVDEKSGEKVLSPVLTMNISDKDNDFKQLIEKLDELGYKFNLKPIDAPVIKIVEQKAVKDNSNTDENIEKQDNRRNSISKEDDTKVEVKEVEDTESIISDGNLTNTDRTDVSVANDITTINTETTDSIVTNNNIIITTEPVEGSVLKNDNISVVESINYEEYDNNSIIYAESIHSERSTFIRGNRKDYKQYTFDLESQLTKEDHEDKDDSNDNGNDDDKSSIINIGGQQLKWYELNITLQEDNRFFEMLNKEIELFEGLKVSERQESIEKIEEVSQLISKTTSPNVRRTDMYIWREIFQLYIDSEIFFTLQNTSKHGVKFSVSKVEDINKKYVRFLEKVKELNLVESFKKKNSVKAYLEFKMLNQTLIKLLIFESLNNLAIYKILKKFNKLTIALNPNESQNQLKDIYIDRDLIKSTTQGSISPFIVKDLCSILTMRLLNLTPQIDDYTCPICCQVAFKPIRLNCGHLFCVRCLIKLQRKAKDECPLCRNLTVMRADETNLDRNTLDFIKLYFPKEIKEKKEDDEKEIFKEQFGEIIDVDQKCSIV